MQPDDNGHFKAVTFHLKFYIICRQVYSVTSWLAGFVRAPPSVRPFRSPSLPEVRPSLSTSMPPSRLPPSSPPLLLSILGLPSFAQNICVTFRITAFPKYFLKLRNLDV